MNRILTQTYPIPAVPKRHEITLDVNLCKTEGGKTIFDSYTVRSNCNKCCSKIDGYSSKKMKDIKKLARYV